MTNQTEPLRVLTFPDVKDLNAFLPTVCQALVSFGADVVPWRELEGSVNKFDIAYLHWYENAWAQLGRHPLNRYQNWAVRRKRIADLHALRQAGTRICWVAHNTKPHAFTGSDSRWDRRSGGLFELVDGVIHLTDASLRSPAFKRLSDLSSAVVHHPHYPLVDMAEHSAKAGSIQRVLMLGAMTSRKNYLNSVELALSVSGLNVLVAGSPKDRSILGKLKAREAQSPDRLAIIDRALSNAELLALFDGNTAVLVNQPTALNSGVLFLAVSRGAPVVCPATPTNLELADKIGHTWIRVGAMTPSRVAAAMSIPVSSELPDLGRFSPNVVGRQLVEFFGSLVRKGTERCR